MRPSPILLFLFLALPAQAHEMSIKFKADNSWQLSSSMRAGFTRFLDDELASLTEAFPSLYWPRMEAGIDFKQVISSTLYPIGTEYKNREFQCGFVRKLLGNVEGEARAKLEYLTDSGKICTQADLPKEKWPEFTKGWMEFLWLEPWIARNGRLVSLEDLIREKIGPSYKRPKFSIAFNVDFDGYGWGISAKERALFSSVPLLAEFARLGRAYNPNSLEPFIALGETVGRMLSRNPYGSAGLVLLEGEIIISPSWAPADMVDLLVHEYGHVFSGEQGAEMEWNEKERTLSRIANNVQEEGVAEAFAWMLLREVYPQYPELKFLHLAKLRLFQEARPEDNHLLGAAGFSQLFHSYDQGSFLQLRGLAQSTDISAFMAAAGLRDLSRSGELSEELVPVVFSRSKR